MHDSPVASPAVRYPLQSCPSIMVVRLIMAAGACIMMCMSWCLTWLSICLCPFRLTGSKHGLERLRLCWLVAEACAMQQALKTARCAPRWTAPSLQLPPTHSGLEAPLMAHLATLHRC